VKDLNGFPARYRKNIRKIMLFLNAEAHTAYSMILMTAALMDLHPEDPEVVDIILSDCGIALESA